MLEGLIERIVKATGPDRELDCLIENALGLAIFDRDPAVGYGDADYMRRDPKPYTASIDAAMTLVPEGCGWFIGWGQTRPGEPMGGARITRNARFIGHRANYDTIAEAEAATPALALCVASLRARISS